MLTEILQDVMLLILAFWISTIRIRMEDFATEEELKDTARSLSRCRDCEGKPVRADSPANQTSDDTNVPKEAVRNSLFCGEGCSTRTGW